ncbi:MAG: hypothetical protein RSC93_02205 [Erysipelotrichaceae bacterium]
MELSDAIQAVKEVEETMISFGFGKVTDIPYSTVVFFKDGSMHLYGELKKRIKENR